MANASPTTTAARTLTLPAITSHDAAPAAALRVQLLTRITTQGLHYRSGGEEAAAASVNKLFEQTRDLLTKHPQATAFDVAATFLLNNLVRSYTARWHGWMVNEQFAGERTRREFRYELKQLQPSLLSFAEMLRLMMDPAKTAEVQTIFDSLADATPDPNRKAELGGPVTAGIGPEVKMATAEADSKRTLATREQINQAERGFIHKRRAALCPETTNEKGPAPAATEMHCPDDNTPVMDATGLCLSGGGIRSATFCLGIVQVLVREGMFPQFDYLSTVSGGGYLGTFLSSYMGTKEHSQEDLRPASSNTGTFDKNEIHNAINTAFKDEHGRESPAVRHLRNNSRYLLNGGLWARIKIFGLLVTGILTNILLMLPFPLVAAIIVFGLRNGGYWRPMWKVQELVVCPVPAKNVFIWLALPLVLAWLLLPLVRRLAHGKPAKSKWIRFKVAWETASLALGLLAVVAGILVLGPLFFKGIEQAGHTLTNLGGTIKKLANPDVLASVAAVLPVVLGLLAARLKGGRGKQMMTILFGFSGPLFYLVVFLWVCHELVMGGWGWPVVSVISGALFVWSWLFVDVNDFSPHGYYRARLCECYLAIRTRTHDETGFVHDNLKKFLNGLRKKLVVGRTGVGVRLQLPLSTMNQSGAVPYHLLNCTVNLASSLEPELRGRDCDFFMFSRYFCGSPVCGYVATEALENLDPHVDLGTAMAISAAAASSNMGVKTQRDYRFLITLLNVRLGYWLRNPVKVPDGGPTKWPAGPGPLYLFRELTGWMHERMDYLNLSDGGHIENLALYELLRRRCKFIVVVDCGMEPGMECADLMLVERYAQIDFGAQLDVDIADLAPDPSRQSRAYAALGKIRYNAVNDQGENDLGWLVYIKLACTGGEPGYVVDYRRQNPDFPHQSTAEQIYGEAQFEAYRRLGESAAESLFRGELAGTLTNPKSGSHPEASQPRFDTLRNWFQALATNLLPDNDPAFEARCLPPPPAAAPQTVLGGR